jgi:hypothetical protein
MPDSYRVMPEAYPSGLRPTGVIWVGHVEPAPSKWVRMKDACFRRTFKDYMMRWSRECI